MCSGTSAGSLHAATGCRPEPPCHCGRESECGGGAFACARMQSLDMADNGIGKHTASVAAITMAAWNKLRQLSLCEGILGNATGSLMTAGPALCPVLGSVYMMHCQITSCHASSIVNL